ncbi:MAG: dTDP-6-deoxy-L-hexose 3-O-methyltransferase [Thermoanaerobaculia bacterium]
MINDTILGNDTTRITAADEDQLVFRTKLWEMRRDNPIPEPELERNPALFIRSSLLARFIAISDVYRMIVDVPGSIFDLGCWWGQNTILFENYRAIYEPFNKQRKIVSFDSFEGYINWSEKDQRSDIFNQNTYSTAQGYDTFLRTLIETHEGINTLGHQRGVHEVIKGDATKTVPGYLSSNPETIVALAAFDLGLYEPTKAVLDAIKPHLVPGSVLLMIHLTRKDLRGDGRAFLEAMAGTRYKLSKHPNYPSFGIAQIL